MREQPETRDIPVIITTGDLSKKQVQDAQALEANAYISKPFRLENIHALIYNGWNRPPEKPS